MAARSFFLCILTTLSFAEDCTDRIFLMNFFHLSAAIITVCPRGGIDKMNVKFLRYEYCKSLTLSRRLVVRLGGKTISVRVIVDGYQSVGFIFDESALVSCSGRMTTRRSSPEEKRLQKKIFFALSSR